MSRWSIHNIRGTVIGLEREVPVLGGPKRPYVNFDNAATTPALEPILATVTEFLEGYSSVHRGTGWKSLLSSHIYEETRRIVGAFVGADPKLDVVIFGRHTTDAINLAARRIALRPDDVVLTSGMEHHANDLPWRLHTGARVEHVRITESGEYDLEDLVRRLNHRVALVAVTAASNTTGYINPVHRIARMAHEAGAMIFVDAAQYAPHRKLDMKPHGDPEHLDFVAFSGHKMYAPFGAGALIGPLRVFETGAPAVVGGGCVRMVSMERVVWDDPPDRDEAGTPNVVGAVAMARAARLLEEIGWDAIAEHEQRLARRAWEGLARIPGVVLYARPPAPDEDRMGVILFNVEGVPDFLTAAILSYEGAIGVRAGCFCSHPYMKALLKTTPDESKRWEDQAARGDRLNLPGAVRVSFGLYNTEGEIDHLLDRVARIARGEYDRSYVPDPATGMYHPAGFTHNFAESFRIGTA